MNRGEGEGKALTWNWVATKTASRSKETPTFRDKDKGAFMLVFMAKSLSGIVFFQCSTYTFGNKNGYQRKKGHINLDIYDRSEKN
jgi:hypothetical protein